MRLGNIGVIFSSAFTGYIQKGVQFLVSIVTLPLIISSLGKVQYGILTLIGQTVGILALSDIGVTNSVGRFISKYIAIKNTQKIRDVIQTAFILLLIVAVVIIAITLSLYKWIPEWLNIPREFYRVSEILFIINGVFLALIFPSRIGQGILAGKQLYPILNLILSLIAIIQLGGVILLFKIGQLDLIKLTFLMLGSNLIGQLIIISVASQKMSSFSLKSLHFSRTMAKEILSLGSSSFFITLSGILIGQGLIIAVGIKNNTAIAGIYGVIMIVITNISFILTKMAQPMVTLSSELVASNKLEKLKGLVLFVMRLSFIVSFFVSVSLFFYIEVLLKLLLSKNWGPQDYFIASSAIILMSISITIGIPQFVARAVLQGVGLHWKASLGKIVASIISFGVGILLMFLGYGVLGASIGWGLTWVLQGIFYFPRLITKFLNISLKQLFYSVYLPGIIIGLSLIVFGYFLNRIFFNYSLISIILCESVLALITVILFLLYQKYYDLEYSFNQFFYNRNRNM